MAVTKRVVDDAGSYREVSILAVMFWAGDGHDHWHVHDSEAYELIRLDNGCRVGTGPSTVLPLRQHPYRLSLAGAPNFWVYGGCGSTEDLTLTTGLSVGWGDTYPAWSTLQ